MELAHNCQINYNALENEYIDIVIFTPNESFDYQVKIKVNHQVKRGISLCKIPVVNSLIHRNDNEFENNDVILIDEDYKDKISTVLSNSLRAAEKTDINILVDYTYMPSIWYSAIIGYFVENDLDLYKVQLYFSYSRSNAIPQVKRSRKRMDASRLSPVVKDSRKRPTALVLGLGQEKFQKEDIDYEVEADDTFAFFPDSSGDISYSNTLMRNNTRILKRINTKKLFKYPVSNTEMTYSLLSSVCLDLRLDHKVVIAPMGPKPFSLNCHLLAAQYPDIQVLSDLNAENGRSDGLEFQGDCIINKVVFCNPDDWDKF